MNRRVFVKQSALALVALGLPPQFLARSLLAETRAAARRKTLICIFQRGAVDGLSMVVPFGEPAYHRDRRSIAIAAPGRDGGALDLDGFFGLHPSLAPLLEPYRRGELAIVNAVGSPHPTRSHFEAQDYMETGVPGDRSVREGWLNRVLEATRPDVDKATRDHASCDDCGRTLDDPAAHAADHAAGQGTMALRGVALGPALPLALRGPHPALAVADLDRFGIAGGRDASLDATFARLFRIETGDEVGMASDLAAMAGTGAGASDGGATGGGATSGGAGATSGAGAAGGGGAAAAAASGAVATAASDALEAIRILKAVDPRRYRPAAGADYPAGEFGRSLRQIAQLIKADVGVEIAFADLGGWDTHAAQGGAQGQLARRLAELARGIRALYLDLGDRMEDVVILTMSEFGRTVAENGTGGTDHGHANCMFALGGGVAGGHILGDWPGLEPEQRYQGRDLALTTDFRDVFGELAARHLGADALDRVFPGHAVDPSRFRGLLR